MVGSAGDGMPCVVGNGEVLGNGRECDSARFGGRAAVSCVAGNGEVRSNGRECESARFLGRAAVTYAARTRRGNHQVFRENCCRPAE